MNLVSVHRLEKPDLLAASDRTKMKPPTREHPLVISASELRDWLRCRVKHHWRHQARLVPADGAPALAIGALVHQLLEAWYSLPFRRRTVKAMAKLAKRTTHAATPKELTTEDLELITAMCVGYAEWAIPEDETIGLTRCEPERWFERPLDDRRDIIVRGKIDNVFVPGTLKRTIGCHEYKTKSQIKTDAVELNLQLSVYLWALRREFPKYRRYIAYYNVLRKQLPGPRVKADLFHREAVERTDDEIDQWAIDTRRACLDMLGAAVYPSPMDSCSWECDYRLPCLMRGRPDDLKDVLKREYVRKEGR